MDPNGAERAFRVIAEAKHLGSRRLDNGTELIGHVPHVAPQAWLHIIFAPLDHMQIQQVERDIGRKLPMEFREFLQKSNGLSLFSGALSLYGWRSNFNRSEDQAWQPFSIRTPNVSERPSDAHDSLVFIGGYRADGSRLYIDPRDSLVHRCSRDSAKPLTTWQDFDTMLASEVERLAAMFDQTGKKVDPRLSTAPADAL